MPIGIEDVILIGGPQAVELTADDLRVIEEALSKMTIQGDRYPPSMKELTGR